MKPREFHVTRSCRSTEVKGDFVDWTAFTAGTVEDVSLRIDMMKTVHTYAFDPNTSFLQNTYRIDPDRKPEMQSGALSSTYGSMFAIQARRYCAIDCLIITALLIF